MGPDTWERSEGHGGPEDKEGASGWEPSPEPWALGGWGVGSGGGVGRMQACPTQDGSTAHCTGDSRGATLALQTMFLFWILGPYFLGCRLHPVYRTDQAKWAFLLLKNPTYSKDKHLKWKNMCEDWAKDRLGDVSCQNFKNFSKLY